MHEANEHTVVQMDMMKDANIGHVQPEELGGEMPRFLGICLVKEIRIDVVIENPLPQPFSY